MELGPTYGRGGSRVGCDLDTVGFAEVRVPEALTERALEVECFEGMRTLKGLRVRELQREFARRTGAPFGAHDGRHPSAPERLEHLEHLERLIVSPREVTLGFVFGRAHAWRLANGVRGTPLICPANLVWIVVQSAESTSHLYLHRLGSFSKISHHCDITSVALFV